MKFRQAGFTYVILKTLILRPFFWLQCDLGVPVMSRERDAVYYTRRSEQEYCCGDQSTSPAIAAIHFELAYRYALLAKEGLPANRSMQHEPIPYAAKRPFRSSPLFPRQSLRS